MAIQNVFIWFLFPNFVFQWDWCFTKQNKDGQEKLILVFWFFIDFKFGLLATSWKSWVLGAEDERSGRRYTLCSLCFQPLPDGTFFLKTMLAFLLSPFSKDYHEVYFWATDWGAVPTPLYITSCFQAYLLYHNNLILFFHHFNSI